MKVEAKISFKEYVKLLYTIAYTRPLMIGILFVDFIMLSWIIGYYTHVLPVPKPTYYQFMTAGLITIVQPTFIFITIWKNYNTSNHLKELLEIEFTQTNIKVIGSSFYTELLWLKIYKVKELKSWFMIYQNNVSAIIIPKKSFSAEQKAKFKKLVRTVPSEAIIDLKNKK